MNTLCGILFIILGVIGIYWVSNSDSNFIGLGIIIGPTLIFIGFVLLMHGLSLLLNQIN